MTFRSKVSPCVSVSKRLLNVHAHVRPVAAKFWGWLRRASLHRG